MLVVLDTNVLVALLVFEDPQLAPLAAAWADGRLQVATNAATAAEFRRVLDYPQFAGRCDAERIHALYRARVDDAPDCGRADAALPRCRDADDQKFLELASACGAEALLTRDKALLVLRRKLRFAVQTPLHFQQQRLLRTEAADDRIDARGAHFSAQLPCPRR